jgi:hypothetical protein
MIVFGKLSAAGIGLAQRIVRIFALTLKHEKPIGSAHTDAQGNYRVTTEEHRAAIRVRAYAHDPSCEPGETLIADSGEVCRPGSEVRVDLAALGPTEIERLITALEPLRDGVPYRSFTTDDINRIACMSGQNAVNIAALVHADTIHQSGEIDLAAGYGLLRILGVATENQLLGAGVASWRHALAVAVEMRLIPSRILEQLERIISLLRTKTGNALVGQGNGAVSSLGDLLRATGTNADVIKTFTDIYVAHDGEPADLWTTVAKQQGQDTAQAIQRSIVFGALTLNEPTLVAAMRDANGGLPTPSSLAYRTQTEWRSFLDERKITPPKIVPGATDAARKDAYAAALTDGFTATYPSRAIAGELRRSNTALDAVDLIERYDLELRDVDINTLQLSVTDKVKLLPVQRILRVTTDANLGAGFLAKSLGSAAAIASRSRSDLATLVGRSVDDPKLRAAYAHAHSIKGLTQGVQSMLRADLQTGNSGFVEDMIGPALAEFPDLATLFGAQTACACEECRSINGPAAYLVDLLAFLRRHSQSALDALLSADHRPEIATLELSCDNTQTPLPRIDIVLEALEGRVTGSVPSYQTTWAPKELRAHPEHLDPNAYGSRVSTATFPWTLPFDLFVEEARQYLIHLGLQRADLLRAFAPNGVADEDAVARARLAMPKGEFALVVGTDNDIKAAWGTDPATLSNVGAILSRSRMTTEDLDGVLRSTWVNPNSAIGIKTDSQCDPNDSTLTGYDGDAHGRIVRWVRLQRRIGWSFDDLDRAIEAIGGKAISPTFVQDTARIQVVGSLLDTPVGDLLTIVGGIDNAVRRSGRSQYDELFRPPYLDNTVDEARVAGALGIGHDDVVAILGDAALDIDKVTRAALLARALGLTIPDLESIRALLAVDPQASASNLEQFVDWSRRLLALPLGLDELAFVFQGQGTDPTITRDRDINDLLDRLHGGLAAIDAEADAALAAVDAIDVVKRRLPGEVAAEQKTAGDIKDAQSILDGVAGAPYASAATLFSFADGATQAALAIAVDPNLTPEALLAEVQKRYASIRPALVAVTRDRAKNALIPALIASVFTLRPDVATSLVLAPFVAPSGAAPLDILRDATANVADQRAILQKIAKQSLLARKLTLTAAEVVWLGAPPKGWLSLSALPLDPKDDVVPYIETGEVLRLRSTQPKGAAPLYELFGANAVDSGKLADRTRWAKADIDAVTTGPSAVAKDLATPSAWIRIARAFAMGRLSKQSVARLSGWAVDAPSQPIATDIKGAARARHPDADSWLAAAKPIRDLIRDAQRRALVDHVAWKDFNGDIPKLSQMMLYDVEVGTCEQSSRIKEAIGCTQNFIEQCLLNVEPFPLGEEAARQWKWMRSFRVWQANRLVFLFPENWIYPELRDDKTPEFSELETTLLSGEMTDDRAETAIRQYLEKLDVLGRLEIVSLYREEDAYPAPDVPSSDIVDETSAIHVLARTQTAPYRWFYRRRERGWKWTPWEKVEVDIPSNDAALVIWNRRPWIFWVETKIAKGSTAATPIPQGDQLSPPEPPKNLEIRIGWTQYRNGRWLAKTRSHSFMYVANIDADNPKRVGVFAVKVDGGDAPLTVTVVRTWARPSSDGTEEERGTFGVGYFEFDGCHSDPSANGLFDDWLTIVWPPQMKPENSGFASKPSVDIPFGGSVIAPPNPPGVVGFVALQTIGAVYSRDLYSLDPNYVQVKLLDRPDGTRDGDLNDFGVRYANCDGQFFFTPFIYYDRRRVFFVDATHKPKIDHIGIVVGAVTPATIPQYLFAYAKPLLPPPPPPPPGPPAAQAQAQVATIQTESLSIEMDAPAISLSDWQDIAGGIFNIGKIEPAERYRFFTFYHPYVCDFIRRLEQYGVDGLLRWSGTPTAPGSAQLLSSERFVPEYKPTTKPKTMVVQPYPKDDVDTCVGSPFGVYNTEVFFHVPFLAADRLIKNQKFEDALRWLNFIFDPTNSPTQQDPAPSCYWNFVPFKQAGQGESIDEVLRHLATHTEFAESTVCHVQTLAERVREWRDNPFNPHLVARDRPGAYQKAVVYKYLDCIIGWADQLFRMDTLEAILQATQLYLLAERLLGSRPDPVVLPAAAQPKAPTWNGLKDRLDELSESIEPYVVSVPGGPSQYPFEMPPPLTFCIPRSEKELTYWDTVEDRLFKIRHCMNINGIVRDLALFEPPIDPGQLVRAFGQGADIASVVAGAAAPPPRYRFGLMLQKANELASEVRNLGASLLSALEKKDAESLAQLRATQEKDMLTLVASIKGNQLDEASRSLEGLQSAKSASERRKKFYDDKKGEFMNGGEIAAMTLQTIGQILQLVTQGMHAAAAGLSVIPTITTGGAGAFGSPVALVTLGKGQWSQPTRDASKAIDAVASAMMFGSSIAATVASHQQRQDERTMQSEAMAFDVEQLQKQIDAATLRQTVAQKEVDNHARQIENAEQIESFLQEKYTNQELYEWMAGQLGAVYFQIYGLAFDMAKRAESAFVHELGLTSNPAFIQFGQWEDRRQGLLAGERLVADIRRMEAAYLEQSQRELEITKHASLALVAPDALLELKQTGSCTFTLPSWVYDLDFPGHYLRRVKQVSITIPCVTGPYQGIPATLTLLSDEILTEPKANGKVLRNLGAVQAIVTSHATADAGLFEGSLASDTSRYLPFEGAGAVSTWRLELGPEELRAFDWNAIADVILHVRYTARDAGEPLRTTAKDAVLKLARASGIRLFSARADFSDAMYAFLNDVRQPDATLRIHLQRELFPFITRGSNVTVKSVDLHFQWEKGTNVANALTFSEGATQVTANADETFSWTISKKLDDTGLDLDFQSVGALPAELSKTISDGPNSHDRFDPKALRDVAIVVHYTFS